MGKILVDGKDQDKERGMISKTLGVLFGWIPVKKVFDKKGVCVVDKKQYKVESPNDINECSKEIRSSGDQVLVARAVTPLGVKEELSVSEIKERLKKIERKSKEKLEEVKLEEVKATEEAEAEVAAAKEKATKAKEKALKEKLKGDK